MNRDDLIDRLRAHRDELEELGVLRLALFGSAARDQLTDESDVDLLVEFDGRIGLLHFVRVQRYLRGILGIDVDPVTPDALHPALRDQILEEAIDAA